VEVRGNAFEKRVQAARQARLREQEEAGARFDDLLETKPPPAPILNGPTVALSNEEVKARELANAQAQCGFNPYAATFSSSTEVSSIMNSVSSGPNTSGGTTMPASGNILGNSSTNYDHIPPVDTIPTANGAVFVLLRQESSLAIAAAETLTKILGNILQNPNVSSSVHYIMSYYLFTKASCTYIRRKSIERSVYLMLRFRIKSSRLLEHWIFYWKLDFNR
jgi:hypothetical protein